MKPLGELILVEKLPIVKKTHRKAIFKCFCGNHFITKIYFVQCGDTKSCGCHKIRTTSLNRKTHGGSRTKLYYVYRDMIRRCNSPSHHAYKDYGGRGITVANQWNNFAYFKDWATNNGYKEGLTLDRINNEDGYSPNNCRFVSRKIQAVNRRMPKTNTTGFTGLVRCWNSWSAEIKIDGKLHRLGIFKTPKEASEAYEKARADRDKMYYEREIKNKPNKIKTR